jgi:molybdate transport system regulatory protein
MPMRQATEALVPRVKVWLECEGEFVLGLGICEILQAVERSGSIKQAARDVGQSYRHVWDRIKEAERARGRPLVESHIGGKDTRRTCLTEDARRLVKGFLRLRQRMLKLLDREFSRAFASRSD